MCLSFEESTTFQTFSGTLGVLKMTQPLFVILENVDLGDPNDSDSNAAMVKYALDSVGYNCRISL